MHVGVGEGGNKMSDGAGVCVSGAGVCVSTHLHPLLSAVFSLGGSGCFAWLHESSGLGQQANKAYTNRLYLNAPCLQVKFSWR